MKKILSVVLAGAMILGMSVASFAADVSFGGGTGADSTYGADKIVFKAPVRADGNGITNDLVEGGDVLYFALEETSGSSAQAIMTEAPANWTIKINNAKYVSEAEFYKATASDKNLTNGQLYVKVTLEDDFDDFEEDVDFYFYIADSKHKVNSDRVKVNYKYDGLDENELVKKDLDWVLNVTKPTTFKYKKGEKAATATLDLDGNAYAELKMYPGEKYTVDPGKSYDKDLSREYGVDVEFLTVRDDMKTILFPADKDNKIIVALDKDGDLVEVDAKYVEDYKFESGKPVDGYLVTDAKYGKYAKVSNKIELEDKKDDEDKVDDNADKPVEDNNTGKPIPDTGANDFVGAAVALAVVSVAAAGALSLKK